MYSARNVPFKACDASSLCRAATDALALQGHLGLRKLVPVAVLLVMALAPVTGALGALFEVIHHLDSDSGYNPYYGAPQIVDGKVYGMTYQGGSNNLGVIYRCDLDGGNYEVLKHFGSVPQARDGEGPLGSVIEYQSKLYGMTRYGGTNRVGVIFRCDLDGGNFEVVKHFGVIVKSRTDGLRPVASLTQHNGQLYGMATEGGTNGLGVLFRCNPDGSGYTVLKDFMGFDGNQPHGDVLIHEGKIYGTTELGGTNAFPAGLIFRCDLDGGNYEILKHLGGVSGAQPFGTPVVYAGQLYCLTFSGGNEGRGVISRCDLDGGNYTVLKHLNFSSGQGSFGSLVLHGTRLYGMTFDGGANGLGVLFQCGLDGGNYSTLKAFGPTFGNPADGRHPRGAVTCSGGKLYGVTSEGGTNLVSGQYMAGVLFRYTLPPAISAITPGSGPVGAEIGVVGHGFTEATNVVFAATNSAEFVVASDTLLTATVPDSAITGPIVVQTPHGVSTSAVHFVVNLVVNHAPVVVSNLPDRAAMYGAPFEFMFDATVFSDEDGDLLSYTATGVPPGINFDGASRTFAGIPGGAGDFMVAVVASDGANPPLAATNTFSINVAKAQLMVTADDKTKVYGAAVPELTASYDGFVNGDTAASLDVAVSLQTIATVSSNVGNYAITASGAADLNYTITHVNGTLSITPTALTITADDKSRPYGTANPSFTISYGLFVGTDGPADLDSPPVPGSAADISSPPGRYPILLSGGLDDNYAFTLVAGTLTVMAVSPVLSIEFLPGGEEKPDQFAIRAQGLEPGATFRVFASADLTEWVLLNDVKVTMDGRFEFLDVANPESGQRFYRVSSE